MQKSIVSLGLRERGRGDYKRDVGRGLSSTEAAPSASLAPRHIRYLGSPTIPNDYSSTTTIPKLNFRFLERTVTMQETCADRCREGYRWGENQNGGRSFEGAPSQYAD
jgi:hypothetical protein